MKFRYNDKVVVNDDFYGIIDGTVDDYMIDNAGRIMYNVKIDSTNLTRFVYFREDQLSHKSFC